MRNVEEGLFLLDSSMLWVGNKKQLFFDNVVIESAQDVKRVMHRPKKFEQNPLIVADKPWEHVTYFSCNTWDVFRDKKDGLFKCWYTDWDYDLEKTKKSDFDVSGLRVLYAHSKDGINWTKPALGLVKENGCETNIVLGDDQFGSVWATSVIDDPLEDDKEKRFKTLYMHLAPGKGFWEGARVEAAYSADGIHWTTYEELPDFGGLGPRLNDVIIMSCDAFSRTYVASVRHYAIFPPAEPRTPKTRSACPPYYPYDFAKQNKRRVWQIESSDFLHWSPPRIILCPDEEDNLDDTFYGLIQFPIEKSDIRLGFLNVFHYTDNTLDVQLVYSRDGKNWQRAGQRQTWLRTGPPGSWDQYMVNIPNAPFTVGDELWVYYGGAKNHHDWWLTGEIEGLDAPEARDRSKVGYALGLAKMRVDGFISLDAGHAREGVIVTRPIRSDGEKLIVNVECKEGGYVKAEIANLSGEALSGYTWDECDTFTGDSTNHIFSWKGNTRVRQKDYFKIHFLMRDARIYAFRVSDD